MALDVGFMAALMDIPYFKNLVDENGEEWFESILELLETDSYDFSRFIVPDSVALSIDEAIELDLAELTVDTSDSVTTSAVSDGVAKTSLATDDKPARRNSEIEQAVAAMSAKAPEVLAAADKASGTGGTPKFDNDARENTPQVPHNSEMIRRYLHDWLALFNPDTSYSAHNEEEAVVVGLNGLYSELKLTAFDDKIYTAGGKGDVTVNAGDGSDTLYLTKGGLKADLGGVSDFGNFGGKVRLRSVENVVGSDGDDTIIGNGEANKIAGRGGDDKIEGGGGDDVITGGGGKNSLSGGEGNDTITGGNSDDVIDGGAGNDKLDGGKGNDTINGGAGDDTIEGSDGNDTIDGGKGIDTIQGGVGDDKISGGEGNDIIRADAGNDTVDGGIGNDTINGAEGDDTIDGGDGDDILFGDAGVDKVSGGKGKDTIRGGDGNDTLNGDDGADKLFGDAGNDRITGGAGADTLTGGAGVDTYIYLVKEDSGTAADTFDIITDFDVASDKFDLVALLANDTFDFIAAEGGAFTGTGAEVRWDKDGGKTYVEIDIDGNGTADMKIQLDDAVDLTASHFNL